MTDFKIGDTVKVTGEDRRAGSVGKITKYRGEKSLWPWHVEFPDKPYGIFHSGELQLVPAEPKEFKVGDIVKVKPGNFVYFAHENKTLIVDDLQDETDTQYRYKVRPLGEDYIQGHEYRVSELEAGEQLAEWEIELLDASRPSYKSAAAKAAHPSNGKVDVVNDPSHYGGKDNPYEVIKVAEAWGFNENAYLFNALKYLGRAGKKGSKVEDLKKLVYYAEREIALEEAK